MLHGCVNCDLYFSEKQRKGLTGKGDMKEELPDSNEEMEIKTEDDIKEEPEDSDLKRNPRARLIVRNLSFKVSKFKEIIYFVYLLSLILLSKSNNFSNCK